MPIWTVDMICDPISGVWSQKGWLDNQFHTFFFLLVLISELGNTFTNNGSQSCRWRQSRTWGSMLLEGLSPQRALTCVKRSSWSHACTHSTLSWLFWIMLDFVLLSLQLCQGIYVSCFNLFGWKKVSIMCTSWIWKESYADILDNSINSSKWTWSCKPKPFLQFLPLLWKWLEPNLGLVPWCFESQLLSGSALSLVDSP